MSNNIIGSLKLNMNSNAYKSVIVASTAYIIGKGFDSLINDKKCETELKKFEIELKKCETEFNTKKEISSKESDIKKDIAFKKIENK